MQILLYSLVDRDSETWKSIADRAGRQFNRETVWSGIDRIPDFPIVIIDQSVVQSAFVETLATAALNRPQQTFVATGKQFSTPATVLMAKSGVIEVLESPLETSLSNEAVVSILQTAAAKSEQWQELAALQKLFRELTTRERDVLDFVLAGHPNKRAAEELSVSVRTVEARRAKVYHKTQSDNVVELVRKVDRLAFLENQFASRDLSSGAKAEDGPGRVEEANPRSQPGASLLSRFGSAARRDFVL